MMLIIKKVIVFLMFLVFSIPAYGKISFEGGFLSDIVDSVLIENKYTTPKVIDTMKFVLYNTKGKIKSFELIGNSYTII